MDEGRELLASTVSRQRRDFARRERDSRCAARSQEASLATDINKPPAARTVHVAAQDKRSEVHGQKSAQVTGSRSR